MSIRQLRVCLKDCAPALSAWTLGLICCSPIEFGDRHAARVEDYLPTPFIPADAVFGDPEQALGPPDGRTVALGRGAYVVLRFFREVPDGPGPDLRIYEIGPDGAEARVAISSDAEEWIEPADRVFGPVYNLNMSDLGIAPVFFVRIRGLDLAGQEPGFDLDAVESLH